MKMQETADAAITIKPLTREQAEAQRAALRAAGTFRAQLLAARGDEPFSPSAPLIRQARAQRSRQLA